MDVQPHWEHIYATKHPDEVSWYRQHLDLSLALIDRAAPGRSAAIVDVGGGTSTLVDDLLARRYRDLTVVDVSQAALDLAKDRVGEISDSVSWLRADIVQAVLPSRRYDVWHDRAVFHFLLNPADRLAYIRNVEHAVRPGGHVIVGTFGPHGPSRCSGLDVMRYDAEGLHGEFGGRFRLVDSLEEQHQTPFGTMQQFVYCYCRLTA